MNEEYRAMWERLGIHMRRHDMLLEALPAVYEKIYLSQQARPQGMGYFDFVVSEIHGLRVKELMDHKDEGGKATGPSLGASARWCAGWACGSGSSSLAAWPITPA